MREKMVRFMRGRYGSDNLNRFLVVVTLVLWALSLVIGTSFYIVGIVGLFVIYFRMLSRNIYRRAEENRIYLMYENRVKSYWRRRKAEWRQRKTHHIYKCPSCKQKIRIPRGKGRIEISCPKCRHTFIKKS